MRRQHDVLYRGIQLPQQVQTLTEHTDMNISVPLLSKISKLFSEWVADLLQLYGALESIGSPYLVGAIGAYTQRPPDFNFITVILTTVATFVRANVCSCSKVHMTSGTTWTVTVAVLLLGIMIAYVMSI